MIVMTPTRCVFLQISVNVQASMTQSHVQQLSVIPDAISNGEPNAINNAIGYAKFRSRSHNVVVHVYDATGNVIDCPRELAFDSKKRSQ
jgi:hypothetical protein